MIVLTAAQARDLRYLVALYRLTVGLVRPRVARGDSIRTGRALLRKGLVQLAQNQYLNREASWVASPKGIEYVEHNFHKFDSFAASAASRAIAHLEMESR